MTRAAMWTLLIVVAAAAAVLSFSALRDLAELCGFAPGLAWLLPVVIDAGAAAGCLVWLAHGVHAGQRFARTLTWLLLASSVAGNAVVHGLSAYHLAAPWRLVVVVSAVAPAVLGAVIHLAVLTARTSSDSPQIAVDDLGDQPTGGDDPAAGDRVAELVANGVGRRRLARELDITEHQARQLLAGRDGVPR